MASKKEDKEFLVATIPWIAELLPKQQDVNYKPISLEDTEYFKNMKASKGQINLKLYQMLNKIFPLYLPKRYHTMDGLSLHSKSKGGQYWTHAFHFLWANQAHGSVYFDCLFKELNNYTPNLSKFEPSFNMLASVESLEQCESAAEFLLEPWVLIQLPFQPVLMHQWTVALISELLRFQKELADFYFIPYPSNLRVKIEKLQYMCEVMYKSALRAIFYVFHTFENGNTCDLKASATSCIVLTDSFLAELMPILEFVMSEECRMIVKTLKQVAWSNKSVGPLLSHDKNFTMDFGWEFGHVHTMYNYEFWRSQTPVLKLANEQKTRQAASMTNSKRAFDEESEYVGNRALSTAEIQEMINVIEATIIKTGRLRGVSRDNVKQVVAMNDRDLKFYFLLYKKFTVTASASTAEVKKDVNYGVIYNFISLYSDVRVAQSVASMTFLLAKALMRSPGVTFDLVGCEGPELNLKTASIQKKLNSVKVDSKWKYASLLQSVKATCFSPNREPKPDYKTGAKNIADHFEERIKNLVFKMIEAQYKTLKKPEFHFYPECQTVQYLLPCFVASFLDLEKDQSISQEKKEKYLNFLHVLITSYEETEFCQKVKTGRRKDWLSDNYQQEILSWKIGFLAKNVNECLFKEIDSGDAISTLCTNILGFMIRDVCDSLYANVYFTNDIIFGGKCVKMKPWAFHTWMIMCRINKCFEKLSWQDYTYFNGVDFLLCYFAMFPTYMRNDVEKMITRLVKGDTNFYATFSKTFFIEEPRLDKSLVRSDCVLLLSNLLYTHTSKALKTPGGQKFLDSVNHLQGPSFPLDNTDSLFWSLVTDDRWNLMLQIKTFLQCKGFEGMSMTIPLDFAKDLVSYNILLKDLAPEGKVRMSQPGEITFFPVEHCRWCGLVEVKEFRTCPECLENPEYLDVNIFCSEKCEKEALEKQHVEEHARFLMAKCGI